MRRRSSGPAARSAIAPAAGRPFVAICYWVFRPGSLCLVKSVVFSLALASTACASWGPETELPVAKDLDCSEGIKFERNDTHTIANGCGRSKSYRCKVDDTTGERSCKVHGDESYGVKSDEWVNGVR